MKFQTVFLALAMLVAIQTPALAYIDPGTGSAVTSAILGFLAAIVYTLRKQFYRLRSLFSGRRGATGGEQTPPEDKGTL